MKSKLLLIIILGIALVLRAWDIGEVPAGFNADEASLGYNAYSILHTGKDEYGSWFPLSFKSFGDYKPGLYVYLTIPFVATLGLNEFAVRLPSIIAGILTVWLIYLIAKRIFQQEISALATAFVLATSPWHIHFSRGAWESNVATFFTSLGILLLLKGINNSKWLFLSIVSFIASVYTYQSPRLTTPILLFILYIMYKKHFKIEIKKNLKYLLLLVILLIPLAFQFVQGGGSARFQGLSIFSDTGSILRSNELRGEHSNLNSIFGQLIHNKLVVYSTSLLSHYFDHFSGNFLFINGDPLIRNKTPETGQFYMIEIMFLIIGLISLLKKEVTYKGVVFAWLFTAPLASSLTYQTPHALRALSMVVPFSLIMGYGFSRFLDVVKYLKSSFRIVIIIGLIGVFIFEFIHYEESYFIHYPKRYPTAWEYGFKEMVAKLNKYEGNYQKVIITDKYDQPYILMLFYKQYDPIKYQPQAKLSERDKFNFGTVRQFDKYEFRPILKGEVQSTKNTLFIGTPQEIPEGVTTIDKVLLPDGTPGFIFAHK